MPKVADQSKIMKYAPTNGKLRKEIANDIVGVIGSLDDLKRESGSIITSENFHLDSEPSSERKGFWKVEIQYGSGGGQYAKKTVAVVMVEDTATDLSAFQDAVSETLEDWKLYWVT